MVSKDKTFTVCGEPYLTFDSGKIHESDCRFCYPFYPDFIGNTYSADNCLLYRVFSNAS